MNAQTSKKGFTIIEVVLVLAIAALIFLMVFVALPALQRGQANTARKSDASTIASAVNTYRTNTNGTLPSSLSDIQSYVDKLSQLDVSDSSTAKLAPGPSSGTIDMNTDAESKLDTVEIYTGAKCTTTKNSAEKGTKRQAAVLTVLETSAKKYATFCQDA